MGVALGGRFAALAAQFGEVVHAFAQLLEGREVVHAALVLRRVADVAAHVAAPLAAVAIGRFRARVAVQVHGDGSLEGAVEVSPGTRIFTGGERAAIEAVAAGRA